MDVKERIWYVEAKAVQLYGATVRAGLDLIVVPLLQLLRSV